MDENPYRPPETPHESPRRGPRIKTVMTMARKLGTGILVIGIAVLAYGALAFFIKNDLPPNGGPSGRLPSLYVLFAGMAAMLLGMTVRGLRIGAAKDEK
jgi:hypothetical protein